MSDRDQEGHTTFHPTPDPTLDAERLARAIVGHSHVGQRPEVVVACGRGHVDECAEAIAAEYARLHERTTR